MGDDGLVSDYTYRALEPTEYRAAHSLFRAALHVGPMSEEQWPTAEKSYEPGRTVGALHDGTLIGTAMSFTGAVAVPGGAVLPTAMVSRVGVRADHTRRGVLTGLMDCQLGGITEPIVTLRATEGPIYRRFGYGVATRGRHLTLDRRRAVPHPGAPGAGRVRILPFTDAIPLLTRLYDGFGPGRPGWSSRPPFWWRSKQAFAERSKSPWIAVVHSGPDGDDGFAVYDVAGGGFADPHGRSVLHVGDFVAASADAWGGLWRLLLSVDLVDEVSAHLRPLDEPLEQLLTDRRVVATSGIEDETWLRLADVPTALAAREYGETSTRSESVVVEVHDGLLPGNAGRYRIGDGPARRTDEQADLVLDVAELGSMYLGDVSASELAMAGRLSVVTPDAVRAADRLFTVAGTPWCGTYF